MLSLSLNGYIIAIRDDPIVIPGPLSKNMGSGVNYKMYLYKNRWLKTKQRDHYAK